jgi:hypothetical protein
MAESYPGGITLDPEKEENKTILDILDSILNYVDVSEVNTDTP